jgi:hypothetical protein
LIVWEGFPNGRGAVARPSHTSEDRVAPLPNRRVGADVVHACMHASGQESERRAEVGVGKACQGSMHVCVCAQLIDRKTCDLVNVRTAEGEHDMQSPLREGGVWKKEGVMMQARTQRNHLSRRQLARWRGW